MNVVWILGAGFSRPLGGPLLADLFSKRLTTSLIARLDANQAELRASLVSADDAYWGLQGYDEKTLDGMPWRNAEEFLELTELAAGASGFSDASGRATQLLEDIFFQRGRENAEAATLPKHVRTYFAAATSMFLDLSVDDGERWDPYHRWAAALRPQDTVITFNYDRVVEKLSAKRPALKILLPYEAQTAAVLSAKETQHRESVDVLKLHGSIDWVEVPHASSERDRIAKVKSARALLDAGGSPLIATPGPGKKGASSGVLKGLWDLACKRIRTADVIVFVGYRFPETDNEAKQRLLEAIRSRDSERPLTAHLVLGADVNATDPRRLGGLLRWALSHYTLVEPGTALTPDARTRAMLPNEPPETGRYGLELSRQNGAPLPRAHAMIWPQPLYAEDFLQVFDRQRLNAWHNFGQSALL